jgi:N12 class adenine-specific DNA methylase
MAKKKRTAEERVVQAFFDFDHATETLIPVEPLIVAEEAEPTIELAADSLSMATPGGDGFFPLEGETTETFLPPSEVEQTGGLPVPASPEVAEGDRPGSREVERPEPAREPVSQPPAELVGGSDYEEMDGPPPEGWRAKRLREGLGRFYHSPLPSYDLPVNISRPTTPDARKTANLEALETILKIKEEKRNPTPSEQLALALYTGNEGIQHHSYNYQKSSDPYFKRLEELNYRDDASNNTIPADIASFLPTLLGRYQPDTSATLLTNSNWLPHLSSPAFRDSFKGLVVGSPLNDSVHKQIGETLYRGVFTDENTDGEDAYPAIFNFIVTTPQSGGRPDSSHKYPTIKDKSSLQMITSLEMTAPGGIVCMVSPSTQFMDNPNARETRIGLQAMGTLESSYRVGNGKEQYDIILFRKYQVGERPGPSEWAWDISGGSHGSSHTNEYYRNHPEHVQPYGLTLEKAHQWFAKTLENIPEGYLKPAHLKAQAAINEVPLTKLEAGEGCLIVENGRVVRVTPTGVSRIRWVVPEDEARAKMMIPIRDAMIGLVNLHQDKSDRQTLHNQRHVLHQAYDTFVAKYGPISAGENIGVFSDTHRHLVMMTENNYNLVDNTADKSEVFTKNIFAHTQKAYKAEDANHAFLLSMRDRNRVDLGYMSELTRLSAEELLEDLEGQVFLDPKINQHVPRWDYLSGDLSEKLIRAKLAQENNPRMAENVRLLSDQMEKDFTDVEVGLGSPIVPIDLVRRFFATYIGVPEDRIILTYNQAKERYQIEGKRALKGTAASKRRGKTSASEEDTKSSVLSIAPLNHSRGVDGVPHAMAHRLLICALHGRVPDIRVKIMENGKEKYVRTPKTIEQTQEAITKISQMKENFMTWLQEEPHRMEEVRRQYRMSIGGYAKPVYSGDHLKTLAGANPTIELRPYQRDGAARMVASEAAYLAYQVGYGKTYALSAGIMEAKRLGLAKRPIVFTMDRLVDGFAVQYKRLYPSARIYTARPSEFINVPGKNKVADHIPDVLKSIASGSYDIAILSANILPHLPISDWTGEYENQLNRERLSKSLFRSATDKEYEDISTRIQEIGKKPDGPVEENKRAKATPVGGLSFDDLGVDMVVCDEFDEIGQAVPIRTSLNITGLPARDNTSAKKLLNIYDMMRMTKGRMVSASGTPLRNSIAEMWIVNRFHRPDLLVRQQALRFDRWFPTFADITTRMEVHVDSRTMRMKTRLGPFRNMRDLMLMVSQYADFVNNTNYSLEGLPKLEKGRPEVIACDSYPALETYIDGLVVRAENAHSRKSAAYTVRGPNGQVVEIPKNDNLLAVCTEGRKAALDMRMINPEAEDHPGNKVSECVRRVAEIYHEKYEESATQMVFCELGVETDDPNRFSTYREIKRKLIKEGLPAREIRFAQEFTATPEHLERAMRSGAIRVLIGNTKSMGAGINVQERLYAMHHLDVTYCARDLEQREGRIMRPGNRFGEVRIFNYVQKGSFDAVMFEHNSFKRKILLQIVSFDLRMNRCDDIDGQTATLEEMKASACRDPILRAALEKRSAIQHEIQKLTILDRDEMQYALGAKENLAQLSYEMENRERAIGRLARDQEMFCKNPDDFSIQLAPLPDHSLESVGSGPSGKIRKQPAPIEDFVTFTTKALASRHFDDLRRIYSYGTVGVFRGEPLVVAESGFNWDTEVRLGSVTSMTRTVSPLLGLLNKLAEIPETLRLAQGEYETQKKAKDDLEKASQQSGKYKGRLEELRREMAEVEIQLGAKNNEMIEVDSAIVEEPEAFGEEPAADRMGKRSKKATEQAFVTSAFARAPEAEMEALSLISDFTPVPTSDFTPSLKRDVNSNLQKLSALPGMQELSPAVTGNYALISAYPELLAERQVVVELVGGMGDLEKMANQIAENRPSGWENPRWRNGTVVINAASSGEPIEICLVTADGNSLREEHSQGLALPAVGTAAALNYIEKEMKSHRATGASLCNYLLHPEAGEKCQIDEVTKGRLNEWLRKQDVASETAKGVTACLAAEEKELERGPTVAAVRIPAALASAMSVGALDAHSK